MANKYLELAVVLSAVDNMSGVIRNGLNGVNSGYNTLANSQQRADAALRSGLKLGAGAKATLGFLNELSEKYGDVDESQRALRISLMKPGGSLDESVYRRDVLLAEELSAKYAGTQQAYYEMERALGENRINPKDILGGIGEAIGQLSEYFKTLPAESAIFAARVKNDMKVPAADMGKMVDLLARLKQVGVGHTGAETITNMTEFYSKAGLGATNMGMKGTNDALELGALGAMFIAKGQDAPSVGTTFRRIFDNVANPKKMKEMNDEAAKFGKHLVFFDKAGNFKGIQNFVAQLGTLKGMDTSAISQILGPAGSKQGMSGDVLKAISMYGTAEYQEFLHRISEQATLEQKVSELQRATNQQRLIAKSNIENLSAAIGKSYNPVVDRAWRLTGSWANSLGIFVNNHQTLTGATAGVIGLAGAVLAVGSAIQFTKAAFIYSRIPALISAMGNSSLWSAMVAGAESFAMTITRVLMPVMGGLMESLSSITALGSGLGSLAALPAALVGGAIYYDQVDRHSSGVSNQKRHSALDAQISALNKGSGHPLLPFSPAASDIVRKPLFSGKYNPQRDIDLAHNKQAAKSSSPLVYSPQITISGGGDEQVKTLKDLLKSHTREIEDMMRRRDADNIRRGY